MTIRCRILKIFFSLIISGFLCVTFDYISSVYSLDVNWKYLAVMFVLFGILFSLLKCNTGIFAAISLVLIVFTCLIVSAVLVFRKNSNYEEVDCGKRSLYGNRKVMLIVPHQDDDLSILGGITEEYLKYGSEVFWVFTTNGDSGGNAEIRLKEAISVASITGVPEDHVIFLGYCDGTRFLVQNNLYNSPGNQVFTSYCGKTETYALDSHPAYNDGNLYTHNNMVDDLCSVILEHQPDIIFCNDYDLHPDHRATSLFVDEAMSKVLCSNTGYRPLLLKSFAYSYTFYGYDDFYDSVNLLSTRKTYETEYLPESNIFNWNDRIRLPVSAASLSRYLPYSSIYTQESMYLSQGAVAQAGRVANGDRVFWVRRTDSISYDASVTCSSGNSELLNDFKILDSKRVWDESAMPFDGVWSPAEDDSEMSAAFHFAVPVNIKSIYLYDSPSLKDNINNILITFDNGNSYYSGELQKNGSATKISVEEDNIQSFTVKIISFEGCNAGLSEIEIYQDSFQIDNYLNFIKTVDDESNFVYDYITPISGKVSFDVYSLGEQTNLLDYNVVCSNSRCSVEVDDSHISVFCPIFSNCLITVSAKDGSISDTVYVSNSGLLTRLGWYVESYMYKNAATINRMCSVDILRAFCL